MPQKFINVGNQSNDGTGDSIREAFSKVNNNFADLYDFLEAPTGFRFANLEDYPAGVAETDPLLKLGPGGQIVATESVTVGTTTNIAIVMKNLVGGPGMTITTGTTDIVIENSNSRLITDFNPTLSGNLIGTSTSTFRAEQFADPEADQDLVTRKFLYDNFLNRDGYTVTGNSTLTNVIAAGGSTLRENISLEPTTQTVYSTLTNFGKVITTIDAAGAFTTIDLTQQATSSTHLTRKDYVDTKISLQGTDTIDPTTGDVNPGFGKMTGPLILSRNPITADDFAPFEGKIAATKAYVDRNDFFSDNNLFVTTKGSDYQPLIPPIRRGRAPQYAFASLNKAAQYAEQLIATSRIQVGDYARLITYNDGIPATVFDVTENFYGNNLARLRLDVGTVGSDMFGAAAVGQFKIFPGQYVEGVRSGAIALIENITKASVSGDPEVYSIAYVDYGDDFETRIITSIPDSNFPDRILMTFEDDQIVPIPEFWVGYKFYTDTGIDNGIVLSVGSTVDNAGTYFNSFLVEFPIGTAPGSGQIYAGPDWHVYANDFEIGETVVYNTDVSALQISFIIESGEYFEQYPIKLPANTSIRGDEFRRVIIRPAPGVSSSPWASLYFRRDAQIDGLQTAALDTGTNYAVASASVTPDSAFGVITVALSGGSFSTDVKGYIFVGNGGQGIIEAVNSGIFTVNLGTPLLDVNTISAGNWAVYKPVVFGRHYLKNPNLPQNNLTTVTNAGGYYNVSLELAANKTFVQEETVAWANEQITFNIENPGSIWYNVSLDEDLYRKNSGIIVDSLVFDLVQGGDGKTIAIADELSLSQSINAVAIDRINEVIQSIIVGTPVSPSSGNTANPTTTGLTLETGGDSIAADLLQAVSRIIDLDPDYNPAKNNADLDVLLCNDANVIRYISCQNHGGFMQVLDPVGQIKNKSPYTQTASSFSQSIAKQRFAGGMFVDGFVGNVTATVVDFVSDPLTLEITGLRRRPQVPTFFMNRGVRYEVSFFADYQPDYTTVSSNNIVEQFYSAKLRLNPLNPGGVKNEIIVADSVGGFVPNSVIPILVEQPSGIGGLVATGYAISTSTGFITDIIIDFPGTGYTSTPFISVGGAIFNNLSFFAGGISGVNIVTGGRGYIVGTVFEIIPVGILGGVKATGTVATVDANGGITSVTFVTNGSGWNSGIGYRVAFGDLDITVPAPTPGFIDSTIPDAIEMVTAGNRSMLANDFTQVNDLGYAMFCTNGSYMENVSMFSYYAYKSYFALNGAQIRTTTGSTCYGEYGLVSDGSDPMEVPIAVTQALPLVQIASAYVSNPLFPAQQGQSSIYVEIDPLNGGYPPLNDSVVEINHNGIRKNYSIGSAGPALDSSNVEIPNVYQLLFNTGNVAAGNDNLGLLTSVRNGDTVIIRTGGLLRLLGFNPASISRPATTLTWNDDPTEVYFITEFTPPQPDGSVLTYTASEYNYITFQTVPQGIVTPTLIFGGTDYSTATTVINIGTAGLISGITSTANGTQGDGGETIQNITLTDTTGIIPGHLITGTNILAQSFVTFVNPVDNIICINQPTSGVITNGAVLTFTAVQPSAVLTITTGTITDITVVEGGTGWNVASTTVSIVGTGTGVSIAPTVDIAGVVGSSIIKITSLDLTSAIRIQGGLSASPVRYYQFALGDQIYEITGYRSATDLGAAWAEIDITPPLQETITQGIILRAGIPVNSKGSITTKISVMRASSHDFVLIGTGGYATTRYPNDLYGPPLQQPSTAREVVESNRGRVFYVSTDQDGNFRVGRALTVNQNRGSVSISVPLDLSNLASISLRRDLGPTVTEFSIDGTMVTEADYKVPTEQAVVTYLNRRLGIDRNGSVFPGSPLGPQFMALSGILPMKGAMNMANFGIINLNTPRAGIGSDASNKDYTDSKISNAGTAGLDTNNITRRPEWGRMTGSLQLYNDAATKTAIVATTATAGTNNITFTGLTFAGNYQPGDFLKHRVYGVGIPDETYVSVVFQDGITLGLGTIDDVSVITTATIPAGTELSFDPIYQAVTKRTVDESRQFNQLVDVALTGQVDRDFVMFSNVVIAANVNTSPPIYATATQLINVANNVNPPTNTPTSSGGGSDITVARTSNTVTFKLVGGTANDATNPITDRHINSFAQIKQAKLLMNTATTAVAPTVGTQTQIQATLGLAQFDSRMFTATSGWVTLVDSTGTTSGVQTAKQAWVPTGGGFLGATNTAANTPATYVNSATMKTWLGDEATAWEFTGDLTPKTDGVQRLGTGAKRWQNLFVSSTATIDGGLALNTLARISTNQTTAEIFTATVTTLNVGSAATTVRVGATSGTLTVGNPTVVGTQPTQTLFDTIATTVQAFSSATTLTIGSGTAATVTLRPGTLVGVNATQNVYNTVATTVNAFGAATAITVGASGANTFTLNHGTLVGSQTTQNVFNTVATTGNLFGAATALNMGAATGTMTVGNPTLTMTGGTTFNMNGTNPSIVTSNNGTANVFNTNALTGNLFGAATTANLASAGTTVRIGATSGTLTIGNPTIVGTQASQDLFNSVATTLNVGSAASTMRIGAASGTLTIGNPTVVGSDATQDLYNTVATTMNFAGAAASLNIGNATAATVTLRPGTLVGSNTTQNVYDTVATTVNAFGAATTIAMGNASGTTTIRGTSVISVLAADGDGSQVTGNWTLSGGATFQATYADLAEWYGSDAEYEPGTVLIFGGESEVTLTTLSNDSRVAGVVTTDPAYIMNVGQEGTRACIALQGRVPVKVAGTIRKGDMLTTSSIPGYACKAMNPTVGTIIGKALENKDDPGTGTIQVAIGRM